MLTPERVLFDTSALYALVSATDIFHSKAKSAYERILDWEWEMWTTSYVVLETSALVHRRLGFEPLKAIMDTLLSDLMKIIWVDKTLHSEAWRRMVDRQGRGLSLADWATIVTAERLKALVFSFDQGLVSEGASAFPR